MSRNTQGITTMDRANVFHDEQGKVAVSGRPQTTKLAYDGSNRLQYVGFAPIGSATSVGVWQIQLLEYDGSSSRLVSVTWANGDEKYDKEWDERASYSYS